MANGLDDPLGDRQRIIDAIEAVSRYGNPLGETSDFPPLSAGPVGSRRGPGSAGQPISPPVRPPAVPGPGPTSPVTPSGPPTPAPPNPIQQPRPFVPPPSGIPDVPRQRIPFDPSRFPIRPSPPGLPPLGGSPGQFPTRGPNLPTDIRIPNIPPAAAGSGALASAFLTGALALLWPSRVAPGTQYTPEEIEQQRFAANVERLKRTELDRAIEVPEFALREPILTPAALEEINVKTRRLKQLRPAAEIDAILAPVDVPQFKKRSDFRGAPIRAQVPGQRAGGPLALPSVRAVISALGALSVRQILGPSAPRTVTPGSAPLPTPTPVPAPAPGPGGPPFQTPVQSAVSSGFRNSCENFCRERQRQKRKKRQKCKVRGNVAWTSGPKRGEIAGTKCMDKVIGD